MVIYRKKKLELVNDREKKQLITLKF